MKIKSVYRENIYFSWNIEFCTKTAAAIAFRSAGWFNRWNATAETDVNHLRDALINNSEREVNKRGEIRKKGGGKGGEKVQIVGASESIEKKKWIESREKKSDVHENKYLLYRR